MIQNVFQIKTLSKDITSFQRRDWLKSERDYEVEQQDSINIAIYGMVNVNEMGCDQ